MDDPELDGCDSSKNLLTAFSETDRKPGRPQQITDEMLRRTRDELLFVLEQNWALVGWDLQQAETPSDLRAALRRIRGINCRSLELFCMEYRGETTINQLQSERKRFQEFFLKLKEAQSNREKCKNSADLAQMTLSKTHGVHKCEELRTFCQETDTALTQANKTLDQLQSHREKLERALRQCEAAFAQAEIMKFIQSERYASTPINFANAMAGLPAITCRQSALRCAGFNNSSSHGLAYRQFLIVEKVFKYPATDVQEAVERMKEHLLKAKGREVEPLNALAENWYILRCAIEEVFQAERFPLEALPFRIIAEYQRRSESQSGLKTLRAASEVITTPAFVKERRRISTPGSRKA